MSYASASDVAAYTPGLLDGNDDFTATTMPSKTAVNRFLSAGCALIEGRLAANGYTTPVSVSSAFYDQIVDLEALYAAGRAEMVLMTARVAATERTRSQMFTDQFNKGLDALMKLDLSRAGIAHTGTLYAGGISRSDKDTVEADTDRVAPRFRRGEFRMTGTRRPSGPVDDDESE